jgi:putative flippase GtrA
MANGMSGVTRGSLLSSQFVRFLFAGGIAACVNFCSRIVLNEWMPYAVAIVLAYFLGMITAFVINRVFVFTEANNQLHHQAAKFVAVNVAAVLQTLAISLLLARIVFPRVGFNWHAETVAHAVGIVVPVVTSYMGHKHWTFR